MRFKFRTRCPPFFYIANATLFLRFISRSGLSENLGNATFFVISFFFFLPKFEFFVDGGEGKAICHILDILRVFIFGVLFFGGGGFFGFCLFVAWVGLAEDSDEGKSLIFLKIADFLGAHCLKPLPHLLRHSFNTIIFTGSSHYPSLRNIRINKNFHFLRIHMCIKYLRMLQHSFKWVDQRNLQTSAVMWFFWY